MSKVNKMALYFCDTSAIVKYYVTEPGSAWIWQLVNSGDPIFLVEITIAEVSAALSILHRTNRLRKPKQLQYWERFEKDCVQRYRLLSVSQRVIHAAALLCIDHPLKGYDAVQVAAALQLQQTLGTDHPLTFIAGDKTVITAAHAEGLAVDNPFWHATRDDSPATLR